jgi:membrane protease YdiL (CAAX protease family)
LVERSRADLRTALIAFAIASVAVVLLAWLGRVVPWLGANLGAAVAIVFLYVPVVVTWRRGEELADYGFTLAPLGRGLGFAAGTLALVLPLFLLGFVWFYEVACATDALSGLVPGGLCRRFSGWVGATWSSPGWGALEAAFVQVVVVALPEELFFRGFLHELLERALPPRRRILGGGVGWALILSSLLFAVSHLTVAVDARRLSVFFPGLLFGWLRSATGSILAGTIVHAASNLFIDALHATFF